MGLDLFISIRELENVLKQYYEIHNTFVTPLDISDYLNNKNNLNHENMEIEESSYDLYNMSNDEFFEKFDSTPLKFAITNNNQLHPKFQESSLIPYNRDVFAIKHIRYSKHSIHSHKYFEINYVIKGHAIQKFESETTTINEGDFCVIAPNSPHDIVIEGDSIVIAIMIRKGLFDTTFFALVSENNILSDFFRKMLYQDKQNSNYILFKTNKEKQIDYAIRSTLLESNSTKINSNNCCINWIGILFTFILRNQLISHENNKDNYNFNKNSDLQILFQYIHANYKTVTLSELSSKFNYSESYLSNLIKKKFNLSFIEIITSIKIQQSLKYLSNTNLSILEVSDIVGYNSSDHFSRTFKKIYGISPQKYKINNILPHDTKI